MKKKLIIALNFIILILFVIASLYVGYYHEPWSDEAQSWLIARDQNVKDIIFYNSRYEGTFPLWFLILKACICLGLSYEYIHVVSTVISAIGIAIILFKTKISNIIKCLIPFSFFVLYQYTVVARSYCLLILAFALLLALYSERHEKIKSYIGVLILFSMISLHGMIISGGLALFYFIEMIRLNGKKSIKKVLFRSICLALVYCFEVYILIPPKDLYMDINYAGEFWTTLLNFKNFFIMENAGCVTVINYTIIGVWAILFCLNVTQKNKTFLFIEIAMIIFMAMVRTAPHHLGILFLIFLAEQLLLAKHKKISNVIVVIVLCMYIVMTVLSIKIELSNNYSGAKDMVTYIKNIDDYENKEIFAIGYKCIALLPYFDENIYANRDITYYLWSRENSDRVLYHDNGYIRMQKVFEDYGKKPEYILLQSHDITLKDEVIKAAINEQHCYKLIYVAEGENIFKGNYSETEQYYLYKLEEK